MIPNAIKSKAYSYGAEDIINSWRENKKYAVFYNNKWIHFGDVRYQDYTTHRDKNRRDSYRSRAAGIVNKYGQHTYKNKNSPNFWAYHLLW